jgi:SAM-dependent methyltransferase
MATVTNLQGENMHHRTPMIRRGIMGRLMDWVCFPIRALFIPEISRFGLSSLRDHRMREVARLASGRVLDVGCGPGCIFINFFHTNGIGIDVFAYQGVEHVIPDMTKLPYPDASFDTVTLIAVGGHIPKAVRKAQFIEFARVLKPGGQVIMTEGEPVTQTLSHIYRHWCSKITGHKGMDDERGMEEEEQYCMPFRELMGYLTTPPLRLSFRRRFMWFLNNIYVAERSQ